MEAYEKMLSLSRVMDEVGDHPGQGSESRNQELWLKQWNRPGTQSHPRRLVASGPQPRPGP